ncbi:MAG: gluconolactonase, partial [Clostridia bacterium]|nr:gluconolactonase [Clostridia bacterium]
ITVLDSDIYIAFDRTRGRVFGYDPQGIMLWAFGTKGNSEGAFLSAVSIEHMGNDLFCLDENESSITVFTPTEYGNLIYQASDQYLRGDYDGSADTWREVLKLNANYNLAFIGIGRALMRQEKYAEAMDYFKMAHDRENYGRAYRYYRKVLVEKYVGWIVAVVACLLIIPLIIKKVRNMKGEVEAYEHRKFAR